MRLLALIVGALMLLGCRREEAQPQTAQPAKPSKKNQNSAKAAASTKAAQLQRGAELYDRMCTVCHGAQGEGYKADQAPRINHPDFLAASSDSFLRQAVAGGRSNTTMSAWATEHGGPLTRADLEGVVAFLRGFSNAPHASLDEKPLLGEAADGAATYARECQSCHGATGKEGPQIQLANPELLSSASNGFLRYAIKRGRSGTPMPGFDTKLSEEEIEDVVALIRSWQVSSHPAPTPSAAPLPLGPVPLNAKGPEPKTFVPYPGSTKVELVKAELDRGARFAVLDARAPSDYIHEHIAGAVSVPFYDPSPYFAGLPKNTWLVCYCSCPHAESGTLAQKLIKQGFPKVTVLDEGLGFWKSKKYPTQTGEKP